MKQKKLLIAVDGNSLLHRAYYALPSMTAKDGTPTGAVFGFLSMLIKLMEREPDYLVVAFDMHGPTFRHAQYKDYKAGRKETPDDLRGQFPVLQNILKEMGILVSTCQSYEADDILGTFAKKAAEENIQSLLVTGDRDALQLISPDVHVLLTKKGISETIEMDEEGLMEAYGLTPLKMLDLKGLMGDSSDNIPGVPGVGEKTALKLLGDYGSMENVLANAGSIKGKLGEKLSQNADLARLSYKLGTIEKNAPIKETLYDSLFNKDGLKKALPLLNMYQLNAIIKRLSLNGLEQENIPALKQDVSFNVSVINNMDDMKNALKEINNAAVISFYLNEDTLCFSTGNDVEYQLCFTGTLLQPGLDPKEIFAALKPWIQSSNIKKYLYDAKNLMHILDKYDITLAGLEFDPMIADYLLNAARPATDLQSITKEKLGIHASAYAIIGLYPVMMEELKQKQLLSLYENVEKPLIGVLYRMEKTGFLLDENVLMELNRDFKDRLYALSEDVYAIAGERFNILSTKQLGSILFEKLALPVGKKTKTGYSTDVDVLDGLSHMHPIINKIQEYRFLYKLNSTFVEGLLNAVDKNDGRVHTSFNQNVTATGRISSTEPNLQNIPVRTEEGRKIRKAFIASPGNVLMGADYSQIELRLLSHISGDEDMTRAFKEGGDIHGRTASEVFGVDLKSVTQEQRSAAKAVNFGIAYGISDFGLAKNLGISKKKAGEYIEKYLDRYKGVREYMKYSVEEGKSLGYVKTLLGRRRDLPELKSGHYNTRAFGERVAMNMPIQGTAADIIKLAMVNVDNALQKGGFKAKLVLQVHDELLFDVPKDEKESVSAIISKSMESAMELSVPLVAQVQTGHSWYETK